MKIKIEMHTKVNLGNINEPRILLYYGTCTCVFSTRTNNRRVPVVYDVELNQLFNRMQLIFVVSSCVCWDQ